MAEVMCAPGEREGAEKWGGGPGPSQSGGRLTELPRDPAADQQDQHREHEVPDRQLAVTRHALDAALERRIETGRRLGMVALERRDDDVGGRGGGEDADDEGERLGGGHGTPGCGLCVMGYASRVTCPARYCRRPRPSCRRCGGRAVTRSR